MKKFFVLQFVLMLALHVLADGSEGDVKGSMATADAKGLYSKSELTLDVMKADDGSIRLYDQKRNIYTVNAAKIPEAGSDAEAAGITDSKEKLTSALQGAVGTFASGDQISAYVVKSVRIEELKSPLTGQSLMPTASAPLGSLGLMMLYKGTQTVHLWDYVAAALTQSPIVVDNLEAQSRIIPREGVMMTIGISGADGSNQNTFVVDFTPDGSGTFNFDQNGAKGVITYEPAANYMADIHWGTARVYDFYKNVLGRNSYDGNGAPIYCVAFPSGLAMDAGGGSADMGLEDGFIRSYSRAPEMPGEATGIIRPMDGQLGAEAMSSYAVNLLAFGAGAISNAYNFSMRPVGELSVICHEFTHFITKSTAQLRSIGEGGGLNESFSDIMAISLMKNADYGMGPDTPWIIGGNGLIVGKSNMRNMADPKHARDGEATNPGTYKGTYWNENDKYSMSSVQSYFYYLLCDGGKGTNDNGTSYDVTGIGIEKGTKIAYLTLTKYCSEDSDYSNIRESWTKAAQELYGTNSTEAQTVGKAWTAVGIGSDDSSGIQELPAAQAADGIWYTIDGRRLQSQPTMKGAYIRNGRKVVK